LSHQRRLFRKLHASPTKRQASVSFKVGVSFHGNAPAVLHIVLKPGTLSKMSADVYSRCQITIQLAFDNSYMKSPCSGPPHLCLSQPQHGGGGCAGGEASRRHSPSLCSYMPQSAGSFSSASSNPAAGTKHTKKKKLRNSSWCGSPARHVMV